MPTVSILDKLAVVQIELGVYACHMVSGYALVFKLIKVVGTAWQMLHTAAVLTCHLGAVSIRKTVLPGMAIPMLKIRRPNGRLIFNMEIAIRR